MATRKQRIAILASGRGSNVEALLRSVRGGVLSDCCDVGVVFSNRPEARALVRASALGFPVASLSSRGLLREEFDARMLQVLEPLRLDYLVLAGFLRILSTAVIARFPGRIVNIHPADTRVHRGLHGYRWAFEQRLAQTTITVHLVDEGLDSGPILEQRAVDLRGAADEAEVERRGLEVEHLLYPEALARLFRDGR